MQVFCQIRVWIILANNDVFRGNCDIPDVRIAWCKCRLSATVTDCTSTTSLPAHKGEREFSSSGTVFGTLLNNILSGSIVLCASFL